MNIIDQQVGLHLRRRRCELALDATSFAHSMDVDLATLHRLEAGAERVSAQRLRVWCDLLDWGPAQVYEGLVLSVGDGEGTSSDASARLAP